MVNIWKCNIKYLWILIGFICYFLLSWCWHSVSWNSKLEIKFDWFELDYNGKVEFEKVQLKTDDLDEIVDLYQEVWNETGYKDSLLIAKKYAKWLWSNAFAQDNLDTLENYWLVLSDIKKTQIWFKKREEEINAVLVEYQITEGLIDEIPSLYLSQLFVPDDDNMILISFITEDLVSHTNASNMFKNIK